MDDLISRQAMLDGIDKLIKIHFDRTVVLYKARKVAEDLPSAQLEPEAISKWKKEFREYVDSLDIARDDWKGIIEYIEELPSAQPERKTGRWIESNPQDSKVCRLMTCSECGKAYIVNINVPYEDWTEAHKFCVECGTDMRGETE